MPDTPRRRIHLLGGVHVRVGEQPARGLYEHVKALLAYLCAGIDLPDEADPEPLIDLHAWFESRVAEVAYAFQAHHEADRSGLQRLVFGYPQAHEDDPALARGFADVETIELAPLARAVRQGAWLNVPELHRIRGEILWTQGGVLAAESALREARATAERLRAAPRFIGNAGMGRRYPQASGRIPSR